MIHLLIISRKATWAMVDLVKFFALGTSGPTIDCVTPMI